MKVLVTGGTGFIGKHLIDALIKEGHQVKVIARNPKKTKPIKKKGVKIVIGDLGNKRFLKKELEGIEVVYHLAAIPGRSWQASWSDYQKVNLGYTQNLLEASLAKEVKRFIFCSSIQAAAPTNFYGRSKLEAEKAVQKAGLEYVIIRPGVVYGVGDKQMVWQICQLVKKGFFPLAGGGKNRLAIVFVGDLVSLFLKTLDSEAKNKTFLGIGEKISLNDLVEITAKALGRSLWRISLPKQLLKIIAIPLETISLITGLQPVLTREQIDFATFDWYFDIPKEERKFWQPKVKFNQGIKKAIKWYK